MIASEVVVSVMVDIALSPTEIAVAVDEGMSLERYAQLKLYAMADGIDPSAVRFVEGYLRFI